MNFTEFLLYLLYQSDNEGVVILVKNLNFY